MTPESCNQNGGLLGMTRKCKVILGTVLTLAAVGGFFIGQERRTATLEEKVRELETKKTEYTAMKEALIRIEEQNKAMTKTLGNLEEIQRNLVNHLMFPNIATDQ